jgi:large subunit ribosomal protein L29
MKMSEIRELSTAELKERIEVEKNAFVRMKLNHAVSPLDNPQKLKYVRKDVARLLTELEKRKSVEQ